MRRSDWWLRPAVLVAVFYGAILVALLATHEWDARFFATVGPQWERHHPGVRKAADGSIYHRYAVDPAAAAARYPRIRTARILYPMAARVLALGHADLVPWTLVLVNLVAIVLGTEVVHRLLKRRGLPSWPALAYGGWVGLGLALLHDTAEPVSYLCALLAIAWLERGRIGLACIAAVGALLGRETTFVLIAPYLLLVPRDRSPLRRWLPALVVLGAWLVWYAILWQIGWGPVAPRRISTQPFVNFLSTRPLDLPATLAYVVAPALVLAVAALWKLRRTPADPALWALVLNALLVGLMPASTAALLWHSARLTTGLVVAALLAHGLAAAAPRCWRLHAALLVTSAAWTIAVTVRYAFWGAVQW